ncbi:FecCD family ABC transporter permease [Paenibacillus soyae]|uniref:Iron ABC transporter permease n=1 Tax=Paenibacillus soyae TaxID=2969249 RepID=A0A9X2MX95_9BACL|nr:iron ABC transporter permease [Paenibacillus soyae]MCR2807511.1 iron ABC transporter permease [Paenibacillus soyae]
MSNRNPIMKTGRTLILPVFALAAVLAATFAAGMKYGTPVIDWNVVWSAVLAPGGEELEHILVSEIRLPRYIIGLMTGALLGASGTLMQGALNNRLAGPELLGISAGASLVIAAVTVLRLPVPFQLQPLLALAGGLAGGAIVVLASRGSRGVAGMLLVGMSVSAMLNGLLVVLIALGTSNDVNLLYIYLLGSLANRSWEHVDRLIPWFAVMLPVAMLLARSVNLLQLGDDAATGLGMKVGRTRMLLLVTCALLVAVTVAQCGPIGYISLLAPHLTRAMLRTTDARLVLPVSAICGAALLSAADGFARLMFAPMEIPVGVWTTLLGGSVFLLYVLIRRGGGPVG